MLRNYQKYVCWSSCCLGRGLGASGGLPSFTVTFLEGPSPGPVANHRVTVTGAQALRHPQVDCRGSVTQGGWLSRWLWHDPMPSSINCQWLEGSGLSWSRSRSRHDSGGPLQEHLKGWYLMISYMISECFSFVYEIVHDIMCIWFHTWNVVYDIIHYFLHMTS